jgi:hypothetical protein
VWPVNTVTFLANFMKNSADNLKFSRKQKNELNALTYLFSLGAEEAPYRTKREAHFCEVSKLFGLL